ncbi:Peptidase inhibitor I78 family protein [compost metagenome]
MNNDEVLQALSHLVGTAYEPSLKDVMSEITGRARIVAPGDASTLEYDMTRIEIVTDAKGLIERFIFG